MIKEMIKKAADGIDLTYDEAAEVTREITVSYTHLTLPTKLEV